MALRSLFFAAALGAAVILSACHSLEQTNFFATGRDNRTFNPQTGRFEWPKESVPSGPRVGLRAEQAGESSRHSSDERVFNPQTGRYEWPPD